MTENTQKPRRRQMASLNSAARMFKAAKGSEFDKPPTIPVSPDDWISRIQRILVAQSRHQWANNDYVKNYARLVRQNVVGNKGILLQVRAKKGRGNQLDAELNDAVETAYREWCKPQNCDVAGSKSLWKIQRLVMNTVVRDGEFILGKVYGKEAGPWGFAVQAIDPQRLPVDYNVDRLANGHFVRHGIEFNKYGRVIKYHFSSTDESDTTYYQIGGRGYVARQASDIIHGFVEELVGQRRGIPWMASGLFRLRHLAGFEDSAVQNARASASKMGFIQYRDGFGPENDDDQDIHIDAEPLSFHELPEGAQMSEWNPQYPSGEFGIFNKAMLRGVAAGMGVLYNNLAGDLEGVNFSSIRQGTLDEREHWKDLQTWLIETLMQPLYDEWLSIAFLSGRIKVKGKEVPATKIDLCRNVQWQGRRWQWIDPNSDVKAAVESKNNLLASPGQIIMESGRDPDTVWRESARDVRAMIDAYVAEGIPEDRATEMVMLTMAPGRAPIKAATEEPAPADKKESQ